MNLYILHVPAGGSLIVATEPENLAALEPGHQAVLIGHAAPSIVPGILGQFMPVESRTLEQGQGFVARLARFWDIGLPRD